jgi:hypothetical protein
MRELKVNIDSLIDALEFNCEDLSYYLDAESGEVVEFWGLDEDGNELDFEENNPYLYDDRYIPIDPIESHEAYRFMERFIPTVEDEHLQDLLWVAINGRGAFRRFKDVLCEYPEERERWFSFQRELMRQWAVDWLRGEGISLLDASCS